VDGKNAPFSAPWRGVITDDGWKYASSEAASQSVLYDLGEDPYELHNRIDDPTYAKRRDQLEGLTRDLARELGDTFFGD
jgi:arylsulfatase A-like enzyme